jgi:hypothetical protein
MAICNATEHNEMSTTKCYLFCLIHAYPLHFLNQRNYVYTYKGCQWGGDKAMLYSNYENCIRRRRQRQF